MIRQPCASVIPVLFAVMLVALGTPLVGAGELADGRVAYWNFDAFTAGDTGADHPSRSGNVTEGTFADQWGANTAYAATLENSLTNDPFDATGGRFGGAFYSRYAPPSSGSGTSSGFGAVASVDHTTALDFAPGEDFTVSAWAKVANREPQSNPRFSPGKGRSIYWIKAEDPAGNAAGPMGLGLRNNQSSFGIVGEQSGGFGQDYYKSISDYTTVPELNNLDDGRWVHMLMVGTYNAGTDDVSIKTFVDGNHISQLDVTVDDDAISSNGPLGIGHFWRKKDASGAFGAQAQHGLGWNARTLESEPGEGWLDDLAFVDVAFTDAEALATYNLAEEPALDYDMGKVLDLLDLHREGSGEVEIDGLTWTYSDDPALFAGGLGEVTSADGDFFVQLADGTGITTQAAAAVPEPASIALWSLLGMLGLGYGAWRRRRAGGR